MPETNLRIFPSPLTIDLSGVYFRPEGLGNKYICGWSPPEDEDVKSDNLDVDYSVFEEKIWPVLARRVPSFETLKLRNAWAGFYDYNYFDQNLIIGSHPRQNNFIFANGSSGHGLQHAPAIGRAISEYLIDSNFKSIDLSRFNFQRVMNNTPIFEPMIV
ncbi:unnamed protein product [Didymodactylos carnosus]|uniref:FAD-dependent oxidoreductase domain-containing protein 1 n=1 Tax=Didymodactylos carnosus TaxID=1234261 RepID=A0A814URH6_9BILA|nr:unnamed protein product [Didymodactylos carnosus]CAF1248464.1 unnamed protein product [Didymodactylos carnosus]CAF3940999.1 unnamed protein product [Didymodactylos carnosus]CAF4056066.1 unnamed protein product [Didymodactylos carnosus]